MAVSVHERIVLARQLLVRAGIKAGDAALDAEVLARHVLGWDRAALVSRWRDSAPDGFSEHLARVIARRAAREPVAYITGRREFWGLDFEVTSDVLIPRPETELIVEEAVKYAAEVGAPGEIIDVGTGSGCIAIALALEFPSARVTGTDICPAALVVARRNAERLGVGDRVAFLQCHLLEAAAPGADLIVSNPPYVPSRDASELQPEVGLHEPPRALFGGPDGLDLVNALLVAAPSRLARDGRLIMEFGAGQVIRLRELATTAGWETVRLCDDLQGIPRVGVFRRSS
ncbi:MAG: peptide chain release factor N(5)-glutamine methyltransferase [Acidobacteriota bacterium]|nr:peptide chain release factor N(5)-glutamine methyltransferase [Acidobacteriota bacterium]